VHPALTCADSQVILKMRKKKFHLRISLSLPRLVAAAFVALLLHSSVMFAAQTASCIFETFSAPSGYSCSQIQGVSDDGTVVGQLVNNKTLQFVAFTHSSDGVFAE
jgi:hypothetical protein